MGTEFTSLVGCSNSVLLMMQSLVGQWMPRWLALWHMPSREEINDLGERLQSIEDQLWRIRDTVGRSPEARERSTHGRDRRADDPDTDRPRAPPASGGCVSFRDLSTARPSLRSRTSRPRY
jgi:hypothetical protein